MKGYNNKEKIDTSCYHLKETASSPYLYIERKPKFVGGHYSTQRTLPRAKTIGYCFDNSIETRFSKLATQWKKETGGLSTTVHKTANSNYLAIIAMGEAVIPCILEELKREPDHWFAALKAITKENPVSKEEIGNIERMTQAWLKWGKERKLI